MENPLLMCGKVIAQNIEGIKINPDQVIFIRLSCIKSIENILRKNFIDVK